MGPEFSKSYSRKSTTESYSIHNFSLCFFNIHFNIINSKIHLRPGVPLFDPPRLHPHPTPLEM
jgi:hypothetical protein